VDYNKTVYKASKFFIVLGSFHLGLAGLFNFDLVGSVLGDFPQVERLVFILVGVSGVYLLTTHQRGRK